MKRTTILISVLFFVTWIYAKDKNFKGHPDNFWAQQMESLYIAGEYESAAKLAFEYFRFVNENNKEKSFFNFEIYDKEGIVSYRLKDHLPSNKKGRIYGTLQSPMNDYEMCIYYYGSMSFSHMYESAWEKGDQKIIHFLNDDTYSANSLRLAYHYTAYIMSDLCLHYLKERISKKTLTEQKKDPVSIYLYYHKAINCQYIQTLFDFRYYYKELPLAMYGELDKRLLFYLPINSSKKSEKKLKKLKNEANRFIDSYPFILRDSLSYIAEKVRLSETSNYHKFVNDYIPYITAQCRKQSDFVYIQTLFYTISAINNTIYNRNKKGLLDKCAPAMLDAMIAYNISDLRSRGAKQYNKFSDIGWRDLQTKLGPDDYCVQFFETTDGSDRYLLVYYFSGEMKSPKCTWMGHSYTSERDAFNNKLLYDRAFSNAERIFYVGLNTMELQDAEKEDEKIHRLHSLAELCMPTKAYEKGKPNLIIAGLNYSNDNPIFANEKGQSNLLGDFSTDAEQIKRLTSFDKNWNIMSADTVTKQRFMEITGKQYNILHISTHGIYDEELEYSYNTENPADANTGINTLKSIYLALSDYNTDNRNRITAHEISQMDLSGIDLVFLSTCHSGSGNINGQRVSSLAKAFHIAGVRNIIAFIGSVQEEDAHEFTKRFYDNISMGMSYHDAFYSAKSLTPNLWGDTLTRNLYKKTKEGVPFTEVLTQTMTQQLIPSEDNEEVKVIMWE